MHTPQHKRRRFIRHKSGKKIEVETTYPGPPPRRRRHRFVILTEGQIHRLHNAHTATATRLMLELLLRAFKAGNKPFRLGNVGLAELGIDRLAKYRALAELERLGLISANRKSG